MSKAKNEVEEFIEILKLEELSLEITPDNEKIIRWEYCKFPELVRSDFLQLLLEFLQEKKRGATLDSKETLKIIRRIRQRLYRKLKKNNQQLIEFEARTASSQPDVELKLLLEDVREKLTVDELVVFDFLALAYSVREIAEETGRSVSSIYRDIEGVRKKAAKLL